jgi:hypothetical protein
VQVICVHFYHHQRIGHRNDLGDQGSTCSWLVAAKNLSNEISRSY